MKDPSYGLGTKPTPGKVDMGCLLMQFSRSKKCEKRENLM